MAEAVALGASVIAFIDIAGKVIKHLREFHDTSKGLPDIYQSISDRLPLLLEKIREIQACCDRGIIDEKRAKLLIAPIDGCKRQVDALHALLGSYASFKNNPPPKNRFSRFFRTVKSSKYLFDESTIRKLQRMLQEYELSLLFSLSDVQSPPRSGHGFNRGDSGYLYHEVPALAVHRFIPRPILFESILAKLDLKTRARSDPKIAVLIGMGGQGKTQLALEICRSARSTCSVFWVDASSCETATQSYERLGYALSGEKATSPKAAIASVLRELNLLDTPFLMVFDNFDSPADFRDVSQFLPPNAHSTILFTSRHQDSARLGEAIEIPPMTAEEGVNLLLHRSGQDATPENMHEAKKIVAKLGGLALAIDQAGSYLKARYLPLRSFSHHYDERREHILNHTPQVWSYYRQFPADDQTRRASVCTTWELSVLGLEEEVREPYMHFLTLAAFFNHASVSQLLFECFYNTSESQRPEFMRIFSRDGKWDSCKYQDCLAELSSISLLQFELDGALDSQFSLHPLVAEWLKLRLESADYRLYLTEASQVLKSVTDRYDGMNDVLGYKDSEAIALHILTYSGTVLGPSASTNHQLEIIRNCSASFANYYLEVDKLEAAEDMLNKSLARISKSEDRIKLDYVLGKLDIAKGRYKLATALLEDVLTRYVSQTPTSDLSTFHIRYALGNALQFQDLVSAEITYKALLTDLAKSNLSESPIGLATLRRLGVVLSQLGKFGESEVTLNIAVESLRQQRGDKHQFYINALNDLSNHVGRKRREDRSEDMCLTVLRSLEIWRGPQHSQTLKAAFNLGLFYEENRRMEEAKVQLTRAVDGWRKLHGDEHPNTQLAAERLARVCREEELFEDDEDEVWLGC